jgi:hypothetical protein
VPGFGRRFHCDQTCLNQFATAAPTMAPTPHPSQEGIVPGETTSFQGFDGPGNQPTNVPTNANPNAPTPGVVVINSPNPIMSPDMGKKCTKEGETCGMAGTQKLFCKCKTCGFKGTTCPVTAASTNAVSVVVLALAAIVALLRL